VSTVEAIRVQEHGGPEVLALAQTDAPRPGPGEVLVQLAAVGVNFVDTYFRTGLYPRPVPYTPGGEGAGTVVAVGEGVDTPEVGDRVASTEFAGAYAQLAVAKADRVVAVPDGIADEVAGAALLQGMTAHYLLLDSYPVRPGDTVLVHAAAGGMGLLLTQLATKLGARVVGTVSTSDKEKLARQAGAAEVIRYDDVAARVRELTGGEGVPAVYDGVGRDTFDASLASLRPHGVLVLFGYASGPVPPFDLNRLQLGGSLYLTRPTLAHFIASREQLARRADDVFGWLADGSLSVAIGGRYPLADARRAHEDLEARRTTGKLLLVP
jgi:NADPH:quinone reductase